MSNKKCKDFNKPVASGYPVTLYHATVDKNSVCETGLKPSCDVDRSALGQIASCRDKAISFTTKKHIAVDIAKDLKTLIKMANGTVTINNIAKELDKVDDDGKIITDKGNWMHVPRKIDPDGKYHLVKFPVEEDMKDELYLKLDAEKKYYKELRKSPSDIWGEAVSKLNSLDKSQYLEPAINGENGKGRIIWSI